MLHYLLIAALASTVAAGPAAAADKAARDPNKVRCKNQPVIGSFVKKLRTCHTDAEWQKVRDAERANAQNYQNAAGSGRSGN